MLRSRASLVDPAADFPSTINTSHSFLLCELASANVPGKTARFFVSALRTVSLAFFAFSLAARANNALSIIAFASFGFASNQSLISFVPPF